MHPLTGDDAWLSERLAQARRIAVLGIKTEVAAGQPAFDVPRYLQQVGYSVLPVPVYYPEAQRILGEAVYRRVQDIPGHIDILNVFRRSGDLLPHLDDILAAKPALVWLQLGIRNEEFAERLRAEGIDVVQDRCILVDHRRLLGSR
jgi:predicted CoA-binding protein